MADAKLKIEQEIRASYERYKVIKDAAGEVVAGSHKFVTDLDMFVLATGIAEEVGLSNRSWTKWLKRWASILQRAEIFIDGKGLESSD